MWDGNYGEDEAYARAHADSDEPEVTVPAITETRPDGRRVQVHPAPLRTYFVSAVGQKPGQILAEEIKAESFAAAIRVTLARAEQRFGDQVYRLTSIVEQPDLERRGPVSPSLSWWPRSSVSSWHGVRRAALSGSGAGMQPAVSHLGAMKIRRFPGKTQQISSPRLPLFSRQPRWPMGRPLPASYAIQRQHPLHRNPNP